MHAGDWLNPLWLDEAQWTLSPLKGWLAHWDSQMPKLDSITVSIYLHLEDMDSSDARRMLEKALEDFVSVPMLRELRVITMDNDLNWQRSDYSKKLLVHWTPSGARKPTLIDSPQAYVETCCECLARFNGDSHARSSDSDDSSDNDHDDGDDSNDGEDGENDFESDEGNNDARNSSHGNLDNCDEKDTENEDQDTNGDSDERDSGDADATSDSENNQAPSYFEFFGLPPEIRDMIYDQSQMLDQETPLRHHADILDLDYPSNQMAFTKPYTSLLLVNSQFSSEYAKRCEGRLGLFISDELEHLGWIWEDSLQIPRKAAKEASSMHIHAADTTKIWDLFPQANLKTFQQWLLHCATQMPKLKSITVNLYADESNFQEVVMRANYIKELEGLTSVAKVTELRLISMENPQQWRLRNAEKELLVHWKRESDAPLRIMGFGVVYEEDCCIGSLASDPEEKTGDTYSDYGGDNSEDEDEEMRLYWDACGE
jgi:hypothetical protein